MVEFLQKALGLEAAYWEKSESWKLEFLAAPAGDMAFLALLIGLAVVAGLLFLYRKETLKLGLGVRLFLGTLRMLVFGGLVFMLLQPVLVFSRKEYDPSRLPVLVDTSESMTLQDAYIDSKNAQTYVQTLALDGGLKALRDATRLSLAKQVLSTNLLAGLAGDGERQVELYAFDDRAEPLKTNTIEHLTAKGQSTRLGSVLRNLLLRYKGVPLAGILVATDGQSNAGDPIEQAIAMAGVEGIPVFSLALGTPEGPRNARLSALEASPAVFVRDPIEITAVVESQGIDQKEIDVVLEARRNGGVWRELNRENMVLDKTKTVQRIIFQHEEGTPMRLDLRARLEGVPSELTEDDNVATARIRVVRQKIRVLFIAGSTFPEVQFLRNALLRDDGIIMSSWLMDASSAYDHPGDRPIKRLPSTQEELDDFDVIILYDPDPDVWLPNFSEMLERFVARAGGGFIYVAGERMSKKNFDRAGEPSLGWLKLLPVLREPGLFQSDVAMRLSSREPWRLDFTPVGARDPIFRFADDAMKNLDILKNLPGMFWHLPVTRAKPGATVLAHHGDPRMRNQFGQHVLLATHLFGPGRTFFVGFDSTYRWRYLDESYFDLFWARMMDRAGRNKQLGGRFPFTLKVDRDDYQPGDLVTLSARFTYPDDVDSGLNALRGEWEVGDRPPEPVTLDQSPDDPALFQANFKVSTTGKHFLRVWSGGDEATASSKANTMEMDVAPPQLEYKGLSVNRALCETLAEETGGRVFDLASFKALPDAFKLGKVERVLEEREELWDAPLVWGLILLLIFIEWVSRKIVRLI